MALGFVRPVGLVSARKGIGSRACSTEWKRGTRKSGVVAMSVRTNDWRQTQAYVKEARSRVPVADRSGADGDESEDPSRGVLRPNRTKDGSLRLFDRGSEEDVPVTLYRDPAYWCPYCQRVQLQLELKKIPYRLRMVNMRCYGSKPAFYRTLVPSGAIPAVMFGEDDLMTESMDIMLDLERRFPDHRPLIPPQSQPELYRAFQGGLKLERQLFSSWFAYMFGGGFPGFGGGGKDFFIDNLGQWDEALQAHGGPFYLGANVSLVDVLAIPFVERMVASSLYWKGMVIRSEFKALDRWLLAMEAQIPAYRAIKADFYSTVHNLPPQTGPARFAKGSEKFQRFVDGQDGGWDLPLKSLEDNVLEPVAISATENGSDAGCRTEAALCLAQGGEKLVKFALRAVGSRPRTVSAPLSDPDATPPRTGDDDDENSLPALLTAAFKVIAAALCDGTDAPQVRESIAVAVPEAKRKDLVRCLAYFRDRIGVPRDMSFGAARQLRAHINWFCSVTMGPDQWQKFRPQVDVAKA